MNGPKSHGGNLTGHGLLLLAMDTGGPCCVTGQGTGQTPYSVICLLVLKAIRCIVHINKNYHNIITSKHKDILEITLQNGDLHVLLH